MFWVLIMRKIIELHSGSVLDRCIHKKNHCHLTGLVAGSWRYVIYICRRESIKMESSLANPAKST